MSRTQSSLALATNRWIWSKLKAGKPEEILALKEFVMNIMNAQTPMTKTFDEI
jgi:hypothetical protein